MRLILIQTIILCSLLALGLNAQQIQPDSAIVDQGVEEMRLSKADISASHSLRGDIGEKVQGESRVHRFSFPWMFFFLLLCLLLIAIAKLTTGMAEIWQGAFNLNIFLQFYRDRILGRSVGSYLLSLNYYLAMSMLIFTFFRYGSMFESISDSLLLPACFLCLVVLENIRLMVISLAGWLFEMGDYLGFHVFNIRFTNRIVGLVILPQVSLALFGVDKLFVPLLWLSAGSIVLLYLFRSYRSLFVSTSIIQGNWFHFILYICSLEIAPFVLVFRAISNHS